MIALLLLACGSGNGPAPAPTPAPARTDEVPEPEPEPDSAPAASDPYTVTVDPVVKDRALVLTVRYGGGCETHGWTLRGGPRTSEDPTVQPLWLHHDAAGDKCRALKMEELTLPLEDHLGADCTEQIELRVPGDEKLRWRVPLERPQGC